MKWIKFFNCLEGRIGRKTFWLMSIVAIAVQLVVIVISGVLLAALTMDDGPIEVGNEESWLTRIPIIALFYPKFVIDAKRGHDRNIPLWVIGSFYACVAVRELLVSFGWLTIFPNQNVISATNVVSFVVTLLLGTVGLALLVDLGFRKGTPGPNQYGPGPLAKA
jgi:uncharacterized membrane protein YhaH (DUF805 family)